MRTTREYVTLPRRQFLRWLVLVLTLGLLAGLALGLGVARMTGAA